MPKGVGGGIQRPVALLLLPTSQPGTCNAAHMQFVRRVQSRGTKTHMLELAMTLDRLSALLQPHI
jgi:hypothetical protein